MLPDANLAKLRATTSVHYQEGDKYHINDSDDGNRIWRNVPPSRLLETIDK